MKKGTKCTFSIKQKEAKPRKNYTAVSLLGFFCSA